MLHWFRLVIGHTKYQHSAICQIKIHHQRELMSAMWKPKFYWLKITPQPDNLGLPDMWYEKHCLIWVIIIILIVFYLFLFVLNFCCSLKQDRRIVKTNMKWSIWVEQLHKFKQVKLYICNAAILLGFSCQLYLISI